jgi:hypothetical protein
MVVMRTAGRARKPAAARVASRAKTSAAKSAKPSSPKKSLSSAAKNTLRAASRKKPLKPANATEKAVEQNRAGSKSAGTEAAAARKATMAATTRYVDDESIVVDERDDAAKAGLSRQRARRAAVRRKDEPSPRVKRTAVERLADPPQASGALLIERVTRAIERELSLIEVIVGGNHLKPQQRTEAERRARTLASLARTLGEVARLRASEQKVKPADDDDAVPRDLDEFRRALSRRLEQLVAAPAPAPDREHE